MTTSTGCSRLHNAEDERFRTELRQWLSRQRLAPHLDVNPEPSETNLAQHRTRQRTLAEAGWAGVAWPRRFGGRGASAAQQLIFHEELARAGAPSCPVFFVGLSHAGPTIIKHGTDSQQRRWLPPLLRGEIVIAQCFSEPGAGSDLAAIRTRAVIDGEHLVITGEKRWSSYAHLSDLCELLVRTDPDDRFGGLTYLIADLKAPGVTIRPIRTLTGSSEFSEVFFDEVRVPRENMLGGIGDGWRVATTTLEFERSTAFAPTIIGLQHASVALARAAAGVDVFSAVLASLATDIVAARALLAKSVSEQQHGTTTPGSNALKLIATELNYRVQRCAALEWPDHLGEFLHSFGFRIGGGTSEIQRNILAERVLGLPRDSGWKTRS